MRFIKAAVAARRFLYLGSPLRGDIPVLKVLLDGSKTIIELPLNADTLPEGKHSLFWNDRNGHNLVMALPLTSNAVRSFEVLQSFGQKINPGDKVWLSGWNGQRPEHFGLNAVLDIKLSNNTSAYLQKGGKSWVIHIHGRTATRAEALRNFEAIQSLGFSQIAISHETDKPPLGLGTKRSYLGASEWKQVEIAVRYALDAGAEKIVLFGFSLGAIFIGEFLRNSVLADRIAGVIFDSPLIDFESTLNFQAKRAGYDSTLGSYGLELIQNSRVFRLLGLHQEAIPSLLRTINKP
ncbi:MAG: hypothetical protein ACKOFA_00560, partial [Rhodoluna sp.]